MKLIRTLMCKLALISWFVQYSNAVINVTLIGTTTQHVCKGEDIDFKWTYDDTDPDKDFIKTIQWSKDPSGYLIMENRTGDLYITSSPNDYTGRVERTTDAGSNDIGMRLKQAGSTDVDDEGKYYVSLIVDKPGGDADDYFVPYRDPQGVQVYVCVGVDDSYTLPSLSLTYDETTHVITCSGPRSLGKTTFAIFDPSMTTIVTSTTDIILTKDITADRAGGTYRCKTYCTRQGFGDTPQGTCLPTDATLVLPAWSSWDDWANCTTPGASRTRTRDCNNPPPDSNGPQNCPGSDSETDICPTPPPTPPPPVNGSWSDWGNWTMCSVSCGNGTQTRNRECDNPEPQNGGDNCTGDYDEIMECFEGYCPAWSSWDAWTSCTTPGASRTRTRDCNNPPPGVIGPQSCPGADSATELCPTPPPVNGSWSEWGNWTTCSVTCDNGTQTRNRTCDNPAPEYGGVNCTGDYDEIMECFEGYCPEVDSVWPVFGPQSGGTNITVRGQHLPRHGQFTVYVGPLECTTIYVNTTIIIARTLGLEEDESHLLDQRLPIYITIDNSKNVTSNAIFTFKRDPAVDSVYPKESIVPGGTFITANGSNFNSVAVIKMETTMVLKTRTNKDNNETSTVYITDCEVLNDNQFKCPTASIILPDVFINQGIETKRKRDVNQLELSVAADISSRHTRSKRQENKQWVTPNGDSTLEFYIGFRLDGFYDYKNFTSITTYAEPLFLESGSKRKFEKGERIAFKGEHLDRGVTVYDYSITIGKRTCMDIELLSNSLSCIPPQTKPVNKTVNGEEIIIHIGLNVDHLAGHLIYTDTQWPLYVWILIGVLSALVIIAIIVTIIVCVKKRKKSTQ